MAVSEQVEERYVGECESDQDVGEDQVDGFIPDRYLARLHSARMSFRKWKIDK